MNKKSFFLGVVTGIVLTLGVLFAIGIANYNSGDSANIQYMDTPLSYEGKTKTSFQVFQVLGNNAALAREESDSISRGAIYYGNTVMILGENFYSDQIVTVRNPQRIGTYSYTNNGGMPMTVPVIRGVIE